MSKKKFCLSFLLGIFVALPALIFAEEAAAVDYELLPEAAEKAFELVNLVLALFVATYAIKLAALSQGGTMEKSWNLLAVAAVFFALLEVNNSLSGFGLIHIGGLAEILEVAFVAVLLVTVVRTRKFLLTQVLGR